MLGFVPSHVEWGRFVDAYRPQDSPSTFITPFSFESQDPLGQEFVHIHICVSFPKRHTNVLVRTQSRARAHHLITRPPDISRINSPSSKEDPVT